MKKLFFCLFLSINLFAQRSDKPLFEIGHQPFLVITASPLEIFDIHNNFMIGAELAPPFGKFSFQADYGVGGRNLNVHPFVRKNFTELNTKILRLELKTYQSDWYNFSPLDKKPLGRYFSLDFTNQTIDGTRSAFNVSKTQKYVDEGYFKLEDTNINQKEYLFNVKYGKHLLIRRFVVFDVYGGPGIRISNITNEDLKQISKFYSGYLGWADWLPKSGRVRPNFALGFRFCVPF